MSRKPNAQSDRNEYIPSFITKKPFYVPEDDESSSAADYLEHQRIRDSKQQESDKWYDRGKKAGPAATKYRKGACENCGAMSHKTKDCLSRPRKQGAKWTGKNIEADEMVQELSLGWDAKRDRWNGYDPSSYRQVVEDYEELERLKKRARTGEKEDDTGGADGEGNDGAAKEEGRYVEESDMGRGQSNSTRQLRLREDTAKYLVNLDLDSARYDPKTRSMVDSGASNDQAAALVAEENFMKASGDAAEFERAQRYAWETQEKGGAGQIHLQANPTSGEVLQKKQHEEAQVKKEAQRKALLLKYGGSEHLNKAPLADAVTENEKYVEYDEYGGIKGAPKKAAKSKYAEDVIINNHTSVWGSWWRDFAWGYSCCHSTVKNSYCTGESGKAAFEEAENMRTGNHLEPPPERPTLEWAKEEKQTDKNKGNTPLTSEIRELSARSIIDGVSEEQMEEFRKSKAMANDPMANMLGRDELIEG